MQYSVLSETSSRPVDAVQEVDMLSRSNALPGVAWDGGRSNALLDVLTWKEREWAPDLVLLSEEDAAHIP